MVTQEEKFLVFECFDEGTGFLRNSLRIFEEESLVCETIGATYSEQLFEKPFELSEEAITRLSKKYGVEIRPGECWGTLRRPFMVDLLPYDVHTNREFELMQRGLKPMSVFSESLHANQDRLESISTSFRPHVESSRFAERRYTRLPSGNEDASRSAISMILVARKAEEWRIDAYILAIACADQAGWGEGFERLEGHLLGYESWQTDAYLKLKKNKPV